MRLAIIAFSPEGKILGESLQALEKHGYTVEGYISEGHVSEEGSWAFRPFSSVYSLTEKLFPNTEAIVFIGACGIAVRAIAPLIKNKLTDPAVVVCDETGRFAISLLSGHVGGANSLTGQIAAITGAKPVITTASDLIAAGQPKNLVLGIGCRRGVSAQTIERAVTIMLWRNKIPLCRVVQAATIDLKKREKGLHIFAKAHNLPLHFFTPGELSAVEGEFSHSQLVMEKTGTGNVCERAAVLCGRKGKLIMPKTIKDGVTAAVFEKADEYGRLYIVGIGPGNLDNMTALCRNCIEQAHVIVGYSSYADLLRPHFPGKTYYTTAMTGEVERCRMALRLVESGQTVCVISSGDSGVYGMASLIFTLAGDTPGIEITVIPGVTAAVSGAALLGAPIGHDFAVISLSDLLTPWEIIEKRLRAAVSGDFAISLYNPGSRTRKEHLHNACRILLESLPHDRLCGIAKNIGREGQSFALTTLGILKDRETAMDETIFIGNSQTKNIGGRMVTPRGYNE